MVFDSNTLVLSTPALLPPPEGLDRQLPSLVQEQRRPGLLLSS